MILNANRNRISQTLHFKRWSNSSYAIFNSIGRVVHIGFLSKIIHGLLTVKSFVIVGLIELIDQKNQKNELNELLIDLLLFADLFDLTEIALYNTPIKSNLQLGDSSIEEDNLLYILNSKAFIRPFSLRKDLFFNRDSTPLNAKIN